MARCARPLKQRKDRAPSVPAATYRGPEWLRWVAPAVIGATALAMFVWSWETWPDVIVDFGRELYVPWRLSAGEVLYRDLAYFNGPLSPYLNSIWFRLFGTSIHVLAFANLAILFALCALMYTLLADIGSRISAFLASLFFVLVFAFSLLGMNFNYISPYSHEMTHGLALSLAALFFLRQFVRSERMRDVGLSGLCLGLVFLTKPEVFVAALAATVVGLGLALWARCQTIRRVAAVATLFFAAALVPPVIAAAALSLAMPTADAVAGTLGGTPWLFSSAVASLSFYRRMMGVYEPAKSISIVVAWSAGYFIVLAVPGIAGLLCARDARGRPFVPPRLPASLDAECGCREITSIGATYFARCL